MLTLTEIVDYAAWFVMIYFSVFWLLVFRNNQKNFNRDPKTTRKPFVSFIVPAHNEEKNIGRTIESLLNLDYPKNLKEIIVIDDGSSDLTTAMVKKYPVKLLKNKKNMGKAYSMNRAIKIAKGEIIACMDADSFVEKSALNKMMGYFKNPDVAAVTAALYVYKPKNFWGKIQDAEYILNTFIRKILCFIDSVSVTPGPFSLYRKAIIKEIGYFDENNPTEDMEIALRIHNNGYKIENSKNAVVYTICPTKISSIYRQRIRWYRGFIKNSMKYKHMMFNPDYGNLGLFFLPLNMIAIFLVTLLLFNVLYSVFHDVITYIIKLFYISFDIYPLIAFDPFKLDIFSLTFGTALALSTLVMSSYIVYSGFKFINRKVSSNKTGYAFYILLFPLIMMTFWVISILKEIKKSKLNW
jgi:cellulose synthase/poly-beta-1,6-N-acetylglucosamine synthase-like glycosyltransferase